MMGTQIEGLIFAVLVIPAALGWLIWQRYMNAVNYLKTAIRPAKKN